MKSQSAFVLGDACEYPSLVKIKQDNDRRMQFRFIIKGLGYFILSTVTVHYMPYGNMA